jgi:hypothetical protein
MTDIDDLRGLLDFGPYRGAPVDWNLAERTLGASVPTDFRKLVDATGPGKIGYDTLLLQPVASDRRYVEPARGGEWEFHAGTTTNLLLRLLRGEEPTTSLSSLASADQHSFTPAE